MYITLQNRAAGRLRCARPYGLTRPLLLALALWALQGAALAAEQAQEPALTFNGFATLGFAHSSEDQADFVSRMTEESGAGYSRSWSPHVDSRLGAQINARITPRLSAVLQLISEQRHAGSYAPTVEWANVQYRITPDLDVRLGRTVLSTFLTSAYRKVGYANTWIRPPGEVYNLIPVTSSDGLDATYRIRLGELTSTLRAHAGWKNIKFPGGRKAKARKALGIDERVEIGDLTLHLNVERVDLSIDSFKPLFDGYRQLGGPGVAVANRYEVDSTPLRIVTTGGSYDPGDWYVMGEWGRAHTRSFIGDRIAWFASGGYRYGAFTPYLIYARSKALSSTTARGLDPAAYPPFLAGTVAGLNAGLRAIVGSIAEQQTISVGTRWDVARDVALKLQLDHTDMEAGSPGSLVNRQPGFRPGGSFNVLSTAVELVF